MADWWSRSFGLYQNLSSKIDHRPKFGKSRCQLGEKVSEIEIEKFISQFSKENNFQYFKESAPFLPYGKITGVFNGLDFELYIYQSESGAINILHTVIHILEVDVFPEGFCIDHVGDIHSKRKKFKDRIKIRSEHQETIDNFLNAKIISALTAFYDKVHDLENSIIKMRCTTRISDKGIYISFGEIIRDMKRFNIVFFAIITTLADLITQLQEAID